jgi:putative chromate ion transporter
MKQVSIRELVAYFLRLGTIGFGGPVALVGLMERDLVTDRGWLTRDEMREAIAISQSLPGPLAIQVGIFISYMRGGFWGAWAGGWAFILPNFLIVAAVGALYVHFGGLSWMTAIFYGVSPAVIALILHSCWRLAKLGMEDKFQWLIAAVAFGITVALEAEVALLFIGAGVAGILYYGSLFRSTPPAALAALAAPVSIGTTQTASGGILAKLLVFFLKAGCLTFGSGLVIVPFLEKGLVQEMGWLDPHQFLIAVAIGMLSPGPVVITATFAGLHHWHLPAIVPADPDRRSDPAASPRECERPRLHQGRLCRGNRHNPRRVRPAQPDRDRRLADRADRGWQPGRSVQVQGEQSGTGWRDSADRIDRIPDSATRLGIRPMSNIVLSLHSELSKTDPVVTCCVYGFHAGVKLFE